MRIPNSRAITLPTAPSGSKYSNLRPEVRRGVTESAVVEGPCAFFAVGAPGRFDNHIHRITCLSDTGHSLHVYSDDALRGEVYREE